MIEQISVVIKKSLQKSAGSLKIMIPTNTVPTAPTPVQTAYAVPMGKVCVARYNRYMLIDRHTKKPTIHQEAVDPDVSFALPRHAAKPTSKNPAMINSIQFMISDFIDFLLSYVDNNRFAFSNKHTDWLHKIFQPELFKNTQHFSHSRRIYGDQ